MSLLAPVKLTAMKDGLGSGPKVFSIDFFAKALLLFDNKRESIRFRRFQLTTSSITAQSILLVVVVAATVTLFVELDCATPNSLFHVLLDVLFLIAVISGVSTLSVKTEYNSSNFTKIQGFLRAATLNIESVWVSTTTLLFISLIYLKILRMGEAEDPSTSTSAPGIHLAFLQSLGLPVIFSIIVKSAPWKCIVVPFCLSAASGILAMTQVGCWDHLATVYAWIVLAFTTLYVERKQAIDSFQFTEQQQRLIDENEKLSTELQASEFRHMIGNVAHDLKTPLSALMTGLEFVTNRIRELRPQIAPRVVTNSDTGTAGSTTATTSSLNPNLPVHQHPYRSTSPLLSKSRLNSPLLSVSPLPHANKVVVTNSSYLNSSREFGWDDMPLSTHETVDSIHESLDDMLHSIDNMRSTNSFMIMTINRCIDYTKASRGLKLVPKMATTSLQGAIDTALCCLQTLQSRIPIRLNPLSKEIETYVITDIQWLEEKILCLVSNAVKYSTRGEVTVSVALVEGRENEEEGLGSSSISQTHTPATSRCPSMNMEVDEADANGFLFALDDPVDADHCGGDSWDPSSTFPDLLRTISEGDCEMSTVGTRTPAGAGTGTCTAQSTAPNTAPGTPGRSRAESPISSLSADWAQGKSMGMLQASLRNLALQGAALTSSNSNSSTASSSNTASSSSSSRCTNGMDKEKQSDAIDASGNANSPIQPPLDNPPTVYVASTVTAPPLPPPSSSSLSTSTSSSSSSSSAAAVEESKTASAIDASKETSYIGIEAADNNCDESYMIRIEVEDHGIGLSNDAKAQLFTPFKQAQRMAGGTGLGLFSLARRVEALHGEYGVCDRRDGDPGSLFWFTFPYRPDATFVPVDADEELEDILISPGGGGGGGGSASSGGGTRTGTITPSVGRTPRNSAFASRAPSRPRSRPHSAFASRTHSRTPSSSQLPSISNNSMMLVNKHAVLEPGTSSERDNSDSGAAKAAAAVGSISAPIDPSSADTTTTTTTTTSETTPVLVEKVAEALRKYRHEQRSDTSLLAERLPAAALEPPAMSSPIGAGTGAGLTPLLPTDTFPAQKINCPTPITTTTITTTTTTSVDSCDNHAVGSLRSPRAIAHADSIHSTSEPADNTAPGSSTYPAASSAAATASTATTFTGEQGNPGLPLPAKPNVLVVDDSMPILKMQSMLLRSKGCNITTAENGAEGLELMVDSIVQNNSYDVVLMDFQMPIMDGLEAVRRLRQFEETKASGSHLCVIGVSANSDSDTTSQGFEAGMDAFISKPFKWNTFITTFKALKTM